MSLVTVHASRLAGHQTDLDNLSADEHERAAAFVFDRDRRRYQECHVRLRHQLGHYLDTTPESLAIITGPFGKPELEGTPCHFNLSHSGDLYAAAFHPEHPIGIDIETGETNGDDLLDLVPHVCHATEKAALERLQDPSEQRRLFLCYWTEKDAFLEAIGCGFQHAPETGQ
ncbi:MAG: 4'-phosphopantetheinyl transferase family protein, partial [Verrucomicrobiales bacterium]